MRAGVVRRSFDTPAAHDLNAATWTLGITALRHTSMIESVRIDQWLFAVRLTKTRADAAAACRGGHVEVEGKSAKPSAAVRIDDRIEAFLGGRRRSVVVTKLLTKRVGAALAAEYYDDHSPPTPERTPEAARFGVRDRGAGRPTKRDRRKTDQLRGRQERR
jgi:ribosome-associated heat shock protein Hsp15